MVHTSGRSFGRGVRRSQPCEAHCAGPLEMRNALPGSRLEGGARSTGGAGIPGGDSQSEQATRLTRSSAARRCCGRTGGRESTRGILRRLELLWQVENLAAQDGVERLARRGERAGGAETGRDELEKAACGIEPDSRP